MMMINYSVSAQPSFEPAAAGEDFYPTNMPQYATNTSAHAVSVPITLAGGVPGKGFLYVHTWDGGDNAPGAFSAGFAVQMFDADANSGNLLYNQTIYDDDMASVEAVILEDGSQNFFIQLAYYRISNQTFEIDLWDFNLTTGLSQVGGYPQFSH